MARMVAPTTGHISVRFNPLGDSHELLAARAAFVAACDRADLD